MNAIENTYRTTDANGHEIETATWTAHNPLTGMTDSCTQVYDITAGETVSTCWDSER